MIQHPLTRLIQSAFFLLLFFGSAIKANSQQVSFDDWQLLTEQDKMPPEVKLQNSNNNLDLVKFHDRYYVAFRTGPTHFASTKVRIYIISSADLKKWDYEYTLFYGSDIREPRFAVLKDSLFLYCFRGGKRMFQFEPNEVYVTATHGDKQWTKPFNVGLDGFVPWRLRNRNDTLWLSAYYGRQLYTKSNEANLRLFISKDGRHFSPISKEPQATVPTSEEGEFIFDKKNDLYATVRLEGFGSLICKANSDSLDKWHFKKYKYKYDSALLFDHNDDIYLIARRNLDGPIDKSTYMGPDMSELPESTQMIADEKPNAVASTPSTGVDTSKTKTLTISEVPITEKKKRKGPLHAARSNNLIRYSITRKRTALFKFDKQNLQVDAVLDFPSTGDCSYPAIQRLSENDYLVMNYSSNIHKKEKNWIRGQLGKTYIYWSILHFK